MVVSFRPLLRVGRCTVGRPAIIHDRHGVDSCGAIRSNQLIMWHIATSYPIVAHLCKPWYAFQATVEQISGCVLDVILMIRSPCVLCLIFSPLTHCCSPTVHALYDRNNRITIFLIALLAGKVLTMVFCAIFTVTSFDFNPVCLPVDTPRSYLPIAYVALPLSQSRPTLIYFASQHPKFGYPSYPPWPRPLSVPQLCPT